MTGSEVRVIFSNNIKRLRTVRGLSQLHLAHRADLAHTFINDIENGKSWVSPETISRLSNALEVMPQELFRSDNLLNEDDERVVASYIDDLSDSVIRSIKELKERYIPPAGEDKK
jgi:transcriptional regulator with XRE-family HTH domain